MVKSKLYLPGNSKNNVALPLAPVEERSPADEQIPSAGMPRGLLLPKRSQLLANHLQRDGNLSTSQQGQSGRTSPALFDQLREAQRTVSNLIVRSAGQDPDRRLTRLLLDEVTGKPDLVVSNPSCVQH